MTDTKDEPLARDNHQRNHRLILLTLGILLAGLCWFLLWYFYLSYYQSTDDAYVNGNQINVTTVVQGTPVAFFADDTDLVMKGQLLVKLDETPYKIRYQKELSSLGNIARQVKQLYESVETNKLNVRSKKTQLERARYDYENRQRLVPSLAVSNEDYVHARDNYLVAELEYRIAKSQLSTAMDLAGSTPMREHPLIETQKSVVRGAFYDLKHCSIYAPATGYVAQRAVEVGQWVSPASPLMSIVPTDYMWIDANFKETQLKDMRIGQPATVTIDLYGDGVKFKGKVAGISMGTGSVFSLIPPQNATGNWIKIVQRLPVRIFLEPGETKNYPLRLGLSAYVDVDITDTDNPMLPLLPHKEAIGVTNVFKLDFSEAESMMETIIEENLNGG